MDVGATAFVALSVAGLFLTTAGEPPCPVQLSHSRVVLKYGDRVSINCTTAEGKFDGIGWEAQNGGVPLTDASLVTWTVESLKEWDTSPVCFFNFYNSDEQCKDAPKVVLYTFPESIDIISTAGSNGVMNLMEEHNLTCKINIVAPVEHLVLKWFRNGKYFRNQTYTSTNKKPSNLTSEIKIKATREESGAVYKCEAHLDLEPGPQLVASQEYNIEVYYGPDVNCSVSPLMVKEGTALEDVCTVTGNPIKSVQWLKDGEGINQGIPLTRDKAGTYTLKAEGHTSIEKNFTILVLYGPELTCKDNQTVMQNVPFDLSCIVEGFPQPTLTFYKDHEEIQLKNKLTRKDAGLYIVNASNSQQTVTSQIDIFVNYPLSQIIELEDTVVDVGSNFSLKCSSSGNPRPEYLWNYYQTSNVDEKREDGVTYLSITNATADNMGLYTCEARNIFGNVSKTVKVTVKGVVQDCPIEITPNRMVVQYQSMGQQATCKSTFRDSDLDLYWLDQQGIKTGGRSWSVHTNNSFNLKPYCVAEPQHGLPGCQKQLNITVYKPPDNISINLVNNASSVVEDKEFQLQCNITNVAPVRNLAVRWYQDNQTFTPQSKGAMHVTDCQPQNDPPCDISLVHTPVTVLFTITLNVTREQSGARFWCEAQLDLGPEGPQPPPQLISNPLNLTVHYKPTINVTKLPKTIPVFNGYPEELVCDADGNPPPHIVWLRNANEEPCGFGSTLTVSEKGFYRCSATNAVGSVTRDVQVILKEDYLPLIAGFVAVVVIITSVIFAFIYSIYYKNTKMRRYSLKNVKLNNTHNGNVAHNSWESQFPMARLS